MRPHARWIIGAALGVIVTGLLVAAAPMRASTLPDDEHRTDEVTMALAEVSGAAGPADPAVVARGHDVLAQAPAAPAADLRRRLNLTEEQAQRVEQILTAYRARTARLRIDLARARLDAREALLEATPDRARLEAIARRIGDLQGQLTRARFEMLVDLKGVLTPEQWMRLQTLRPGRWFRAPGR
ncbi:MAG: Spy/CpxP family protein refolding chaperone [Armatimonadota bacterium]|nr:Spy/CpxP family protein refolding chaperone [Armatimonadota bacterium]